MTVIVGVVEDGVVWLGADSFTGGSEYALLVGRSKLFRLMVPQEGGEAAVMLLGASGDWRAGWLLEQMVDLPAHEEGVDAFDYLAGPFVDKLRELVKDKGWGVSLNGREGADAHVLIGYGGRLFSLWDEYQVVEGAEGYMAMGAGMYLGLGALAVTGGIAPGRRLEIVLEAVERHHAFVRRPFVVECA